MKPSFIQELAADPDAAARRLIHTAHHRDGLPEIAIGTILLTTAFIIWLQIAYPPGSLAYRSSSWGMMLLIVPMIGGSQWAIKWTRRRFLMAKVGYVEPKPAPRRPLILATCIAFAAAAAMAWAVYRRALPPGPSMVAGTGIAGGLLAVYAGRLPRYIVGGVLMAALGICLGLTRVSFEKGSMILYGAMGLLSLLSGCVVLLHFLRMADEETD